MLSEQHQLDIAGEWKQAGYIYIQAAQIAVEKEYAAKAPSVLYRPSIMPDGNQWCALYGVNLQDGVCGFGDTPALAMADFDKNWYGQKLLIPSAEPQTAPQETK